MTGARGLTRRQLLALSGAAAITALAGCTIPRLAHDWRSTYGRDHPLAGRYFAPAERRFLAEAELVARLTAARYVLLGETHDNPDHHLLQARAIRALVDAGRRPTIAFEMIAAKQGDALARHLAARPDDAAGLGAAIGWERSGWPDWSLYRPIAEVALGAGLTLAAANLDPETVRALGRGGADRALADRLDLDTPLPSGLQASLEREIAAAHCFYVEGVALKVMALGQRARDAEMARRLIETATEDGAVLIAGSGHCRTDRGVPYHLRRGEAEATIASLAYIEVSPEEDAPGDYAGAFDAPVLPFDLVCFTARIDARDACERFKDQLEKMRERRAKENS